MLPPNFLTIPQIQHERHAGSKLMHLTPLLEYLLRLYDPDLTTEAGREPSVGERVYAHQQLFEKVDRVFWALKVRNSFAHALEGVSFSERDQQNAVNYLIEAIGDVCRQPTIPRELVQKIYHDPDADLRSRQAEEERRRHEQQAQLERERPAQSEQAGKLRAEELRLEQARLQHAQREKELQERKASRHSIASGLRKLVVLALLVTGGFYVWPKLMVLYKGDKGSAAVVRTAAELALKRVREKRKQQEYAGFINQADAAWRDGEIEFRRGNFKLAEAQYRQVIGLWDGLNARMAESLSFEELLAEVNGLRRAATNAQAPEKAAGPWQQAEELRRNAVTARKNGNLQEAKNLIIQARQQYEAAQATALTAVAEPSQKPETAVDNKPTSGPAEIPPTAQPEPPPSDTTASGRPTLRRRQPSAPPAQNDERESEDKTFTISAKEFMQYVAKRVNPVLPPEAKQAGVAGPVVVRVYLSKYGHLSKAEVIEGNSLLREAALAALRQWSFKPYLLDRVPTEIKSEITIYVR